MRTVTAAAVLGLILAGCSGSGDPQASLTEPIVLSSPSPSPTYDVFPSETGTATPSPSPSPTPTVIDITTTPDEVTVEYVDAVIDHALAIIGQAHASVMTRPPYDQAKPTDEELAAIRSVTGSEYRQQRIDEARLLATSWSERYPRLPPHEYVGLAFETIGLNQVTDRCVVAVGRVSRAGTVPDGGPSDALTIVSLQPADSEAAAAYVVWDMLTALDEDRAPIPQTDVLAMEMENYGGFLENDCTDDAQ